MPLIRQKRRPPKRTVELDSPMLIFGLIVGAAAGAIVGLLNAPRSGIATRRRITGEISRAGESVREKIDDVVTADAVSDSIAEGKAAARRRQAELGLVDPTP